MRIKFPDYDGDAPGGIVEREVPDEIVQRFINWLLTCNRYAFENNPRVTVEKVTRLKLDLTAAARQGRDLAPVSGRAEITVEGLLALCDCETVEQLVDKVALSERVADTVAVGDGIHDDTDAIQRMIDEGGR